ncbi:MAG: NUDIX domain-containing protein [Candidatus Peribacteria bacterium]|nr:NUDIX domain-containing protein [Candidatus Peribacteria bacterium]
MREVKEETGFDVEIVKLTGVYAKDFKNEVCFLFECRVIGGELTLNEEARAFSRWTLDELPKAISERQVARVKDFLTKEDSLTTRVEQQY